MKISAIYFSNYPVRGGKDRGFNQPVKWDIDLLSGYEARFLPGADRRDEVRGFFSIVAPGLWREIRTAGLDAVVVHGHTPAAMLVAIGAARSMNIPVFMRAETHLGLRRSRLKRMLRRATLRRLYSQLDGVLAIGTANAEFYRTMGVPNERIFLVPYAVDNRRFEAGAELSNAERRAIRSEFGVDDERPIVLYAAKLQRRKRPDDLVRAAAILNSRGVPFQLVMVGSGEMEPSLRSLAAQLGVANLHFRGFVNQRALPGIYGACDLFVLPSEDEPWGLAINEAMCAGLPIIASSELGCVPDLVWNGLNGTTFRAGSVGELADKMEPLLRKRELRDEMGAASRRIIAQWSYAECCEGLKAALVSVARRRACRPNTQ